MPKPGFTDIIVVLDRSGSMENIAESTIQGVNKFVASQKAVPGQCVLTLAQFDHEYQLVYSAKPIADVPDLTAETFVPRGQTALLDAIGRTIKETGERLSAMAEEDRPEHVVVVISTDGLENNSRFFSAEMIQGMITHQTDVYKWQFVYLGANQDAIATAKTMGIMASNAMTFTANTRGVSSYFGGVSAKFAELRAGVVMDMAFTDEDRQKQEEAAAAGKS